MNCPNCDKRKLSAKRCNFFYGDKEFLEIILRILCDHCGLEMEIAADLPEYEFTWLNDPEKV